MVMRRTVLLLAVVAAALLMAGCSEPNVRQDEARGGMSKEEEKLNQRIAELEEKVNDQSSSAKSHFYRVGDAGFEPATSAV
jgi:outer membrane murein-binding lipoprotein Lpp